ncbi:EamA family transporter [Sulfurospirillum arcachonense]|uniref:EamA family transporter n=1 Tax=Sulfurospirillum arcachonense TaxID=57666 RepID=UPI000467F0E1|nr:EamA family transporter [Sulfurospirillum arcachonense]
MILKDVFLALLVVFIWGVNFTVIKIGLEEIPPILFSAMRFAVVAIPAVFFIPFPKTSYLKVLGVGVFLGVIKFSLLFVAMDVGISAGLASLTLQIQVVFTIVLSILIFKESISKVQILGIGISLIGFVLFFFTKDANTTILGLVLILLAGFSWAISNLIMKKTQGVDIFHFMVWVSLVPPLPLLIISYFTETQSPFSLLFELSLKGWGSIVFVGFISTLLAFALWGKLLKTYSSALVTPFALLIPVVGILTSSIILDETLNYTEVAGTLLVMSGLIICVLGSRLIKILIRKQNAIC